MIEKILKLFEGKRTAHPVMFLSQNEKRRVAAAIREAESKTSGEIHIHLTGKKIEDVFAQGKEVFEKLGMTKTSERNGVLILIGTQSKRFAVLADLGIHSKMDDGFLGRITEEMEKHFRGDRFSDGLVAAVQRIGDELKAHFPHKPGDRNELSNEISYSE